MRGIVRRFLKILLIFILFIGGTVYAFRPGGLVYKGDFDVNRPVTWHQGEAPYSDDTFPGGGTYGESSCGAHTLAALMIKAGIWGKGKTAVDAAELAYKVGILSDGSKYGFTDEKVKEFSDGKLSLVMWKVETDLSKEKTYDIIESELDAGHYIWVSVNIYKTVENDGDYPSGGHAVLVDYIDEDGKVVIIDSGGRYKYLDDVGAGESDAIAVFKSSVQSSKDAPKFWEGEDGEKSKDVVEDDEDEEDGGDGYEGGYDDDKWEDPIIKYQDEEEKKVDNNQNKGLERDISIWDILFE